MGDKVYFAIDLNSFYASVECVEQCRTPCPPNLVKGSSPDGQGHLSGRVARSEGLDIPGREPRTSGGSSGF